MEEESLVSQALVSDAWVSGSRTVQRLALFVAPLLALILLVTTSLRAQTNCEEGNGLLDFSPPKTMSVEDVIKKFGSAEAAVKAARQHYTYKQDVLMQSLTGASVT
ncbi:MAG: hypothetical protein WAL56_06335, partial [Candidatus Sulfotelmatobacter sp.]